MRSSIPVIAAPSYLGGRYREHSWHPRDVRLMPLWARLRGVHGLRPDWRGCWAPPPRRGALAAHLRRLRAGVLAELRDGGPLLVLGGDHANAMAVWDAALETMGEEAFGLLWIDAHLDCHTFRTSPSGNPHGMPLAALLGLADPGLTALMPGRWRLRPEALRLLGVRSYERPEIVAMRRLGVPVTMARQARGDGLTSSLDRALSGLEQQCRYYGISIDLDAIDPAQAPAVATPVAGGLDGAALCEALRRRLDPGRCRVLEVAEFYPSLDRGGVTQRLLADLIGAWWFAGDAQRGLLS